MKPAVSYRAAPYSFKDLPRVTGREAVLCNWYSRLCPRRAEWRTWLAEILGHVLQTPAGIDFELTQTHLVDPSFEEKRVTFGSKQEIFIGRDAENDIVLAGKAIAGRHARLVLRDQQLLLEDLGGTIGTYLWDKRIRPSEPEALKNGDQFSVFPYCFHVAITQAWRPEGDVVLGECSSQVITSAEFLATTPARWRLFAVKPHPKGKSALLSMSPSFLAELQQRLLGPLRLRTDQVVSSDDTLVDFVVLAMLEHLNRRVRLPAQFSLSRPKGTYRGDESRGILVSLAVAISGIVGQPRIFLPLDFLPPPNHEAEPFAADYPPGLSWNFPVSIGFVDLSPQELTQVAPGDVLVTENVVAALLPNDFSKGWTLLAEGSNFRSFRIDKYFERTAEVGAGEPVLSAAKPEIGRLPIRLHVVLGEKEFTLAEIQSLGPGAILELEAIKPDCVRLMANGKVIGEGELVEVEGRLAVRVLGWRSS